jgi:hypothetical protein
MRNVLEDQRPCLRFADAVTVLTIKFCGHGSAPPAHSEVAADQIGSKSTEVQVQGMGHIFNSGVDVGGEGVSEMASREVGREWGVEIRCV